jgi:hypothetical protein
MVGRASQLRLDQYFFDTASLIPTCGGIAGVAVSCTGNEAIQTSAGHCEPAADALIDIRFTTFANIYFSGSGAAIYVSDDSVAWTRSDAFMSCRGGWGDARFYGAGAYLNEVASGTSVNESCGYNCYRCIGSFVFLRFER